MLIVDPFFGIVSLSDYDIKLKPEVAKKRLEEKVAAQKQRIETHEVLLTEAKARLKELEKELKDL